MKQLQSSSQSSLVEEAPIIEAPAEIVAPTEPVAEVAQEEPAVEAPLQAFEVTEPTPIETTLEKVLKSQQLNLLPWWRRPTFQPTLQKRLSGAFGSDGGSRQRDQTPPAEENEENTTE